jgi:hypothetical protein
MRKSVIVLDSLREAINTKLDAALERCPDAAKDREFLYSQLLEYFDVYGVVPDFTLKKKA